MEDGYVQNLPQASAAEGLYTQMIDSQHPNFLSLNYFPPLYNQV